MLPMHGARVRSLVGELRSHMLHGGGGGRTKGVHRDEKPDGGNEKNKEEQNGKKPSEGLGRRTTRILTEHREKAQGETVPGKTRPGEKSGAL